MLKNMEFGVRQNRFKPSPSDSQTRAFVHKEIEKVPSSHCIYPFSHLAHPLVIINDLNLLKLKCPACI